MADGLNRYTGIGNLGADPELKVTASGQAILKITVACNTSYFDKATESRKEVVEWVRGTVFGKRAEGLAKVLNKGDRVYFEGALRTSSYEKEGVKHYSTEVVVDNVILAGGGKRNSDADDSGAPADTGGNPWEGAGV